MSEVKAPQKAARLVDVAEAAGVSRGTASNVFSHPELVREEVRERVQAAARKLGYRGPDPKGRLLRAGKVGSIGIATARPVSYFFEDPFARVLMSGISSACDENGEGISLVAASSDAKLAENIRGALVDGFILFCVRGGGSPEPSKLIELTRERQLPFVALELGFSDDTVSSIGIDNFEGARLAARHLAELGHRRFAVLSLQIMEEGIGPASAERIENAVYADTRKRIRGYFAALSEFGIDTTKIPVYETRADEASTRANLERIFASDEPPTAILAMSDRVALAALAWFKEHDIRVPQDVSVIGFDGIPGSEASDPPLTTIAQPIAEIGRRAVQAILDYDGTLRRQTIDVELVVRGSTAEPRS